jgi:hypothetical protein
MAVPAVMTDAEVQRVANTFVVGRSITLDYTDADRAAVERLTGLIASVTKDPADATRVTGAVINFKDLGPVCYPFPPGTRVHTLTLVAGGTSLGAISRRARSEGQLMAFDRLNPRTWGHFLASGDEGDYNNFVTTIRIAWGLPNLDARRSADRSAQDHNKNAHLRSLAAWGKFVKGKVDWASDSSIRMAEESVASLAVLETQEKKGNVKKVCAEIDKQLDPSQSGLIGAAMTLAQSHASN